MKIIDGAKKVNKKVAETAEAVKHKACDAANWVVENPVEAIKIGVGILTIVGVVKDVHMSRLKDRKIWDPVNGIYWFTKRPMTGSEKLEFEHMVATGCERGRALDEMGLLNKRR